MAVLLRVDCVAEAAVAAASFAAQEAAFVAERIAESYLRAPLVALETVVA